MVLPLTRDQLIGSWRLVSASSTSRDGEIDRTPFGENPSGMLTYTADGHVSALISHGGRKPLPLGIGKPEERLEAFRTFFGYAGRYSLDQDRVVHHVEVSSIQNYVGKDLVRTASQQGERLVLVSAPSPVNQAEPTFELIWERLKNES